VIVTSTAVSQSKSSRGSCAPARTGGPVTPGGRGRGECRSWSLVVPARLSFLLAWWSCLLVVLAFLSYLRVCRSCRSCLLVVRFVPLPGPCCLGRVHGLGDELVAVRAVVGCPVTDAPAAQPGWVRPPAGRRVSLLRETSFCLRCWVPARLLPRARGDRLVHSGPPVQVVKEVVHAGQDGRTRHVWGSGRVIRLSFLLSCRSCLLVVRFVPLPGPCCLGRVHELGDELVVACAVVGLTTGAPAAQSGWVRPPAGRGASPDLIERDLPSSGSLICTGAGSQPGCCSRRAVIVSSTAVSRSKSSRRSCTPVRTGGPGTPGGRGRGDSFVVQLVLLRVGLGVGGRSARRRTRHRRALTASSGYFRRGGGCGCESKKIRGDEVRPSD